MTDTPANTTLGDYRPKNTFSTHPDNPLTKNEFDFVFKNREANGFKDSFVKLNSRKFLIHIPTFLANLNSRRGM